MASKKFWIECIDKSDEDVIANKFIENFDTLEEIKEWLTKNPDMIVIDTTLDVFAYLTIAF